MDSNNAPTVKIGDDGQVLQCAKGASAGECGYTPGDAVCSKCGATAVEVKMYGQDSEEQWPPKVSKKKKKKKNPMAEEDMGQWSEKGVATYGAPPARAYGDFPDVEELAMDEEEEEDPMMAAGPQMEDPENEMAEKEYMNGEPMEDDFEEMEGGLPYDEEQDDEEDEMNANSDMMMGKTGYIEGSMGDEEEDEEFSEAEEAMEDEEEMGMDEFGEEDEEKMGYGMYEKSDFADLRLKTLGFVNGEMGENPFVCAIERKVYPGNSQVCENCPGGCVKEGDMPALLEMEGVAEDMFRGKVLDSGYSDKADIFVIDVERKDGKPIEAFFDGTTGECMGWHMLNEEVLNVKSGFQPMQMVGFSEAAQIATKSIHGDVVSVEADVFEGFDSYAVEIEGVDGKSYDVFVSLDGEVLGYDTYTQEEAFAIESEAAEIALKRAYGEDVRKQMAERGDAMEDGEMPIANDSDLRNAVMAWPRSKKRQEAKNHIMARAKALGLEKSLPDEWIAEKKINEANSSDANFLSSLVEFEMLSTEEKSSESEEEAELYFKRMFSDESRAEHAKQGHALPDGSYPIVNESDLKNAIQAFGRAKDKEAAKAHIMKRAKALGKEDLIPENWK